MADQELNEAVNALRGALKDANDDLRSKIGDTVVYKQKGEDGAEFGTTIAQALFWTDYRTKIIEAKINGLTDSVNAIKAKLGV